MPILAENLSVSFDQGKTFALDGVNLRIEPGEFVAVIGLSGAGKSTFLRTINAMVKPTGGKIQVLGNEVSGLRSKQLASHRRQIGFIFQQFNLVKSLTVVKNVLMGRIAYSPLWRSLTGMYAPDDFALARKTLDSVGLRGRHTEKVRNLSGGQQQRVAIARALVQQPRILLADEPMASLDPKLSEVVIEILERVNREQGITVLVNIHVLEYARKYAKRIIAFRKGKVVFDGPPAQLSEDAIQNIYEVNA